MSTFNPARGSTTSIPVVATSANAKVRTNADPNQVVRMVHASTSYVFVTTGSAAVTASTTDMALPPSSPAEFMALHPDHTHVAAITAGASVTLYLAPGSFVKD